MVSPMKRKLFLLCTASLLLEACVSTPVKNYAWGSYETQVYNGYSKPEKATPQIQIDVLEKEVAQAGLKKMPIAPGVYAHIGYQYLLLGNKAKALEYFSLEKQNLPESSVYIDFLVKKIA